MAIVRYTSETVPKPTKEDWELAASVKEEDIDCSDIPEITDFSRFRPIAELHQMYRPKKVAVTCKLDADVVLWLKQNGKGYQTRMNAILRDVMVHDVSPPYHAEGKRVRKGESVHETPPPPYHAEGKGGGKEGGNKGSHP